MLTWSDAHLHHVVLVKGPDGLGRRVGGLSAVLQQAHCLLLARWIGHKVEAGCWALYFFSTPALTRSMQWLIRAAHPGWVAIKDYLTLVEGEVANGVVRLAPVIDVRHFLESCSSWKELGATNYYLARAATEETRKFAKRSRHVFTTGKKCVT